MSSSVEEPPNAVADTDEEVHSYNAKRIGKRPRESKIQDKAGGRIDDRRRRHRPTSPHSNEFRNVGDSDRSGGRDISSSIDSDEVYHHHRHDGHYSAKISHNREKKESRRSPKGARNRTYRSHHQELSSDLSSSHSTKKGGRRKDRRGPKNPSPIREPLTSVDGSSECSYEDNKIGSKQQKPTSYHSSRHYKTASKTAAAIHKRSGKYGKTGERVAGNSLASEITKREKRKHRARGGVHDDISSATSESLGPLISSSADGLSEAELRRSPDRRSKDKETQQGKLSHVSSPRKVKKSHRRRKTKSINGELSSSEESSYDKRKSDRRIERHRDRHARESQHKKRSHPRGGDGIQPSPRHRRRRRSSGSSGDIESDAVAPAHQHRSSHRYTPTTVDYRSRLSKADGSPTVEKRRRHKSRWYDKSCSSESAESTDQRRGHRQTHGGRRRPPSISSSLGDEDREQDIENRSSPLHFSSSITASPGRRKDVSSRTDYKYRDQRSTQPPSKISSSRKAAVSTGSDRLSPHRRDRNSSTSKIYDEANHATRGRTQRVEGDSPAGLRLKDDFWDDEYDPSAIEFIRPPPTTSSLADTNRLQPRVDASGFEDIRGCEDTTAVGAGDRSPPLCSGGSGEWLSWRAPDGESGFDNRGTKSHHGTKRWGRPRPATPSYPQNHSSSMIPPETRLAVISSPQQINNYRQSSDDHLSRCPQLSNNDRVDDFHSVVEPVKGPGKKPGQSQPQSDTIRIMFQISYAMPKRRQFSVRIVGDCKELGGYKLSHKCPVLEPDPEGKQFENFYQSKMISLKNAEPGKKLAYKYFVWDDDPDDGNPNGKLYKAENFSGRKRFRELVIPDPKSVKPPTYLWLQKDKQFEQMDSCINPVPYESDSDDDSHEY